VKSKTREKGEWGGGGIRKETTRRRERGNKLKEGRKPVGVVWKWGEKRLWRGGGTLFVSGKDRGWAEGSKGNKSWTEGRDDKLN